MKLRDLLATIADGVIGIDPDCRITYWNDSARELLGYEAREALGRPCYQVLAGQDQAGNPVCHANCVDMAAVRQGKALRSRDLHTRGKFGHTHWISVTSFFSQGVASDPSEVMLVHVIRDVTMHRQKERLGTQILAAMRQLGSLEALEEGAAALPPFVAQRLSRREAEVLGLLCSGASAGIIAERLFLSVPTVRKHIHSILGKLGVRNCLEAVAYVARNRAPVQDALAPEESTVDS